MADFGHLVGIHEDEPICNCDQRGQIAAFSAKAMRFRFAQAISIGQTHETWSTHDEYFAYIFDEINILNAS